MNRGSPVARSYTLACSRSFNEAPIHESGKCGGFAVVREPHGVASMRPRFMNRGSWQVRRGRRVLFMLQ